MEVNELIKALRRCGNTDYKEPDCDNCPLRGYMCVKQMLESAADTLEELQAQLVEKGTLIRQQAGELDRRDIAIKVQKAELAQVTAERDVARDFACAYCFKIPCRQNGCPCWGGSQEEQNEIQ